MNINRGAIYKPDNNTFKKICMHIFPFPFNFNITLVILLNQNITEIKQCSVRSYYLRQTVVHNYNRV